MEKSIYKITNLINKKVYIGQSSNPKRRFQGTIHYKENILYPIRNSSSRVYNPVETIPSEIGSRVTIDT